MYLENLSTGKVAKFHQNLRKGYKVTCINNVWKYTYPVLGFTDDDKLLYVPRIEPTISYTTASCREPLGAINLLCRQVKANCNRQYGGITTWLTVRPTSDVKKYNNLQTNGFPHYFPLKTCNFLPHPASLHSGYLLLVYSLYARRLLVFLCLKSFSVLFPVGVRSGSRGSRRHVKKECSKLLRHLVAVTQYSES